MNIAELARAIHEWATKHGWHNEKCDSAACFALIHSEWSEALEAYRAGEPMEYTDEDGKPEGVCVELIDGCMRILDFLVENGRTPECIHEKVLTRNPWRVPSAVNWLHEETAKAYAMWRDGRRDCAAAMMCEIIAAVFAWVTAQGCMPMAIMRAKHEYNQTRTYRHGGKAI